MLLQATGQLPGAVAQGGVGVGFILRKRTGQGFGVHRFRNRFEAGARVLVLHNLGFPADQILPLGVIAAPVLLRNKGLVGMQLNFIFFAGQHRLSRFRGLIACQNLIPGITFVRVLMGRFFLLTTDRIAVIAIAVFPVCMAGAFRHSAHQIGGFLIAGFGMDMLGHCGLGAGQFPPLPCITGICMGMDFRNCIAAVRVPVRLKLRQHTHKTSVFVPAGGIMLVNHSIRFHLAGQNAFFPGGHLGIAEIRMCVLRNLALLFQCDGWQNEGVGRAEHNHCRQTGHDLIPAPFSPVRAGISLSIPQDPFIHPATSSILFQFSESAKGENPEYNFSNNLFLRHTANLRMPGIHRGRTVVAHAEVPVVRHLVGQLQIAVAKGFFLQVGLVQQLAVHIDVSFLIDIHPLARTGNAALHQNLVPQIKRHQIALVKLRAFEGDHNVALIQRRRHGRSVNLKNRHPDRRHQHGDRRHNDQRIQGAAQNRAETGLILYPLQLRGKLINGGAVHRFLHHRIHFVPVRSSAKRRTFSRYCCAALSAASNTAFSRIAASAMEPAFS